MVPKITIQIYFKSVARSTACCHARSIESQAKFSSSRRSPVNHSQQTVVKLLVPPMVTAMTAAPTHPLAPTARQMGHPHHSDVAIAAVQWF